MKYFKNLKTTIRSNQIQLDTKSESTLTTSDGIIPVGLPNPHNHCYINSVLQIISRIFIHFTEEVHINNNEQGCLVKYLIDSIYSGSEKELSQFKIRLTRFDSFF